MVNPYIACHAVEAQRSDQFRQIFNDSFTRQHRLAPDHRIEMQIRKTCRTHALAKSVDRLARGFHRTVDLHKFRQIIDGEVWTAVHHKVGGMQEIAFDDEIGDGTKHLRRNQPGIKQLLAKAAPHRVDVDPIVIRPHQGKIDPVDISRLKKSLLKTALKERTVLIVIPIEDKMIDAVIHRRVDLLLHHLRVGFILMTPQWHLRLLVPRETRNGMPDQLPLGPTGAVDLCIAGIGVIVREVVAADPDTVLG